jgi:hypothetical protein
MLAIDEFRLYILGNSATDLSLNNYTITNSNVTLDNDENGVSHKALLFNSSSDELQLSNTVAQAIAVDINNAFSLYIRLLNDSGAETGGRLFSQMDQLVVSYSLGISANDSPSPIYFYTTKIGNVFEGAAVSDFTKNTWSSLLFTSIDAGSSTINKKIIYNGTEIQSRTDGHNLTSKTEVLRIGKRQTDQNFQGKISTLICAKKVLSNLEVAFIEKFENMKRCA